MANEFEYIGDSPRGSRWSKWIRVRKKGWRLSCCDCGLVHEINFRTQPDGTLELKVARDSKATGGIRAAMKRTGRKKNHD